MIRIKNKHLKVNISEKGAEITSIIKDKFEYLWQGDPDVWAGQAPNLFPFIGRLKNEEYIYDNKTYKMIIHGFASVSKFEITEQTESYVSLRLSADSDTYESYPFNFELFVTYELIENSIKKKYLVINNDFKTMYYEVGGHEGYNLTFAKNKKMDDYFIEFSQPSVHTYTTDKNIMLNQDTTEIPLVDNKLYLKPSVFENDALILDTSKFAEKKVVAGCEGTDKKVIVYFDDFSYLGIWTRPYYSNYICIEPWSSLPDGNYIDKNLENKIGIRKLEPTRSEIFEYTMEIS